MSDDGNGWPRESVEKALLECADDLGVTPSCKAYAEWREDYHPSLQGVYNNFGTWNAAKEVVGLPTDPPFGGSDAQP